MKKKIKVIYIGGSGRSGSTVLTKLLNFWPGLIGVNEICYLWEYGIQANHPVSDGTLFNESDFWNQVLASVYTNRPIERQQVDFFAHTSQVGLKNLILNYYLNRPLNNESRAYAQTLKNLYASVLKVSGEQYVIDSSKTPDYAFFLSRLKSVDMVLLHLVRDPRGVAYSWGKKFIRNDVRTDTKLSMTSFGIVKATLRWIKWNIGCELVGRRPNVRYLRVRYEDFVKNPQEVLDDITVALGLPIYPPHYHFEEGKFYDQHGTKDISIWGNPIVRTISGSVKVNADNEWRGNLSTIKKLQVTLLTFPLLFRYGYKLLS
ncbi:MAG: sulfotransferase [Tunicatimonas sp.]